MDARSQYFVMAPLCLITNRPAALVRGRAMDARGQYFVMAPFCLITSSKRWRIVPIKLAADGYR